VEKIWIFGIASYGLYDKIVIK